jgi:beta propeller repeat protein
VTDSNSQQYPDIADRDFIVWQDDRHGNWDVYGYEPGPYGTGTEFAISTEAANQVKPDVSEGIVVWQDARNDGGDIYAARICSRGNDQCDGECVIELLDDQPYYGSTEEMAATYWAGHDEPLKSSCGFNDFVDAWHVYRPTIGGPVTITTDESPLDTILSVFNSCHTMDDVYEDPIELACNDDYCLAHAGSKVTLAVVKGKSYYVRVSGFNDQRGDYRILVERGAATNPILSDLNGDGRVNMLDFAVFSAEWLMTNQPAE